ncbi:hypothetical protein [Kitasatospora sp. NBC_01539]|uniref:hypothetical protein n=1 Tax=Kitasatospora sp. NBC_01539 TaxID=2903577 RepID=UPI0038600B87
MRMSLARALVAVAAVAAPSVAATGTAGAVVPPEHAVIVCQSASFYANYDSASGPVGLVRVLGAGNKVGHTRGAHPVYNGWAATFDFGKGDWGYVRIECLGGYGSW